MYMYTSTKFNKILRRGKRENSKNTYKGETSFSRKKDRSWSLKDKKYDLKKRYFWEGLVVGIGGTYIPTEKEEVQVRFMKYE